MTTGKNSVANERVKPTSWAKVTSILIMIVVTVVAVNEFFFSTSSIPDTIYHASQSPEDSEHVKSLMEKYGSSDGQVHVYAYFPVGDVEQRCFHVHGDPRQGSECYPVSLSVEWKKPDAE